MCKSNEHVHISSRLYFLNLCGKIYFDIINYGKAEDLSLFTTTSPLGQIIHGEETQRPDLRDCSCKESLQN